MNPLVILPARSKWWRAILSDSEEGVTVEIQRRAMSEGHHIMCARQSRETFEQPFHVVRDRVAELLDGLREERP